MDPERIMTLHPEGKEGVRIERPKYVEMRQALLAVTAVSGEGTLFKDLPHLVAPRLDRAVFPKEASVKWYVTTVKLDLEARGELVRVKGATPQRLLRG